MKELEDIAKVIMDMQRSYSEIMGDFRKPYWNIASRQRKMAYIKQVEYVLSVVDCTPEELHDFWVEMKKELGWVAGSKNRIKKLHPYLIPYLELPEEIKNKYKMFIAVVTILK